MVVAPGAVYVETMVFPGPFLVFLVVVEEEEREVTREGERVETRAVVEAAWEKARRKKKTSIQLGRD